MLDELPVFIDTVRRAFGEEANEYLRQKAKDEEKRQTFLKPKSGLQPGRSLLMVLRQWNSFTPALPSDEDERSRGGGYFLWHNGHGTVIDPGYNFIENFDRAGCRICDIDNVILTHAHNDHTIDFESLRVLLHEYNDNLPKGDPPKRVRFFLNNGSYKKFAGLLELKDNEFTESVRTLNPGNDYELLGGGRLRVLPAYHDELLSIDHAVGLLFFVETAGEKHRKVLFTSDTGLFPLKPGQRKPTADASDPEKEIWKQYLAAEGRGADVMVVHIGSIKESEFYVDTSEDLARACYANHLGLIGTARVIVNCRPKLVVVSEFGEEMRHFRTKLVATLQEKMLDIIFRTTDVQPPRAVPGDLAFVYDLEDETICDCVTCGWSPLAEVDFAESHRDDENEVYYFAKGSRQSFLAKPKGHIDFFNAARAGQKGLYFCKDAD